MPIHNHFFRDQNNAPAPPALVSIGPLLQVQVMLPPALAALLGKENQPIPPPQAGWALIDTGATRTCVDKTILEALGVQPTGSVTTGTAAGPVEQSLYPAKLNFPAANFELDFGSVVGVDLSGQSIAGQDVLVLVGRDVLAHCILSYNGPGSFFTLAR